MREERQISHAKEFQITQVDVLLSRKGNNSLLLKCGFHIVTSFQRARYIRRGKD